MPWWFWFFPGAILGLIVSIPFWSLLFRYRGK